MPPLDWEYVAATDTVLLDEINFAIDDLRATVKLFGDRARETGIYRRAMTRYTKARTALDQYHLI